MIPVFFALLQVAAVPSSTSCTPGFQLTENDGTVRAIAEKKTDHRKLGNVIGASFFGGLLAGPMTVKTVLNGAAAEVRTKSARPNSCSAQRFGKMLCRQMLRPEWAM